MTSQRRALFELYQPVAYRKYCYPKAAKKKRILKKWRNRFQNGEADEICKLISKVTLSDLVPNYTLPIAPFILPIGTEIYWDPDP